MSRKMMELKELLCKELDEIGGKGELSAGDLETAHKLTDTIKNIDKICMLEGKEDYSLRDGNWQASMHGDYSGRSMHYPRMHYSGDGRYSYHDAKGNIMSRLEMIAADPSLDEFEKAAVYRAMEAFR